MGPIFDHREAEVRLFRWPRTGCKISVVSAGVVGHAVCRGWGSAHTDVCTHIGEGGGRDRFSTIEKRRCDYACGRAQAGRVSARDGAPAQAACPSEIRCAPALQLAPVACNHECNFHLCTLMTSQAVRDSSKDSSKDCFHGQFGRLTSECRARATRPAYNTSTRSGTSTSCNESRPLALRDEETAAAVTRDTAQHTKAGAI